MHVGSGVMRFNWRLIAVPSFLFITISFSCGPTITDSNVIAQQHKQALTMLVPPFSQCQGVCMTPKDWRALKRAPPGHGSDETLKHVQRCKRLGQSSADKMVDIELGTLQFIFKFWVDAMKIQRCYCNSLIHFRCHSG